MSPRFTRDRLILYSTLSAGFLVHWVYGDLVFYPGEYGINILSNCWQLVCIGGLNLLYFEYALPFIFTQKNNRAVAIVISVILHLVVLAVGLFAWRELGALLHVYQPVRSYAQPIAALAASARFVPGSFLVFAVVKLFFDYAQLKYEGQQAKLEAKQAELQFLKSQVNPHFLFNTLNNIYSLSQHQPHLVSESILRLSKILRYLLYETDHKFITVDKEINILTDYIDLEKLRYIETVAIDLKCEIDDFSEMMPPLLLIPLVENAFKHGVSVSRGNRFVDVRCSIHQRQLHLVVRNSAPANADDKLINDNIGLSNLRRRLDLLYKTYQLVTAQKDSVFTADLKIDLSSHV